MRKTAGYVFGLFAILCFALIMTVSYEAKAELSAYEEFSALIKEYYKEESDGFVHIYVDDSGHAEYDLCPKLPERFKYVDEIGPSETGKVQIKFTPSNTSGKSYISVKDNKVIVDYDGNPDDLVGEWFWIEYDVKSDANFSFNGAMVHMKFDRASTRISGSTRAREGETVVLDLELKGYDHDDITWMSSDNSVLRPAGDTTGMSAEFIAVGAGRVTVSAVVNGTDGLISVPKPVTVTPKKAGSINISKATLYTGESVVLEIANLPDGAVVTYSSSASSKVKVGKNTGRITAVKKGSATVTAKVDVPASKDGKAYSYKLKSKIKVKDGKATTITTLKQLQSVLTDTKGGRYKLGADISGVSNITVKKGTYRLDLNGHTIYGKNTGNSLILVSGGNLTITDSKGDGKIINESDQDAVSCEKGKLNIYGGEYVGVVFAVFMEGSGTLNIYGGKFKGLTMAICLHSGYANIYGGSFEQESETLVGTLPVDTIRVYAFDDKKPGVLTVNGGAFKSNYGYVVSMYGTNGSVTLNGGTFEGLERGVLELVSGKVVINGGEYYYKHRRDGILGSTMFICNPTDPLSCTVNDGVFINKDDHIFFIQLTPDVFINGGYYEIKDEYKDEDERQPILDIVKTFDGTLYLEPGLIDESRIQDDTPKGKGLIATEFTRNKTKYKKGMLITDPDDLYSAMMDAMEDLRPEFVVKCSNDFYKLMLHYSHIWNDGIKSTSYNWKESSDTSLGKNTRVLEVTVKLSYLLEYQIEMAPHSKESMKNADKEAVEYSKKVDNIIAEVVKDGMSAKEKAVAIHDYMVKNYSYGDKYAKGSHYVWGLLDDKKGVCQAYANLYRILCRRAGLECYCISGIAGDKGKMDLHMWNLLVIDGKELFVDVTFDDTSGTNRWLLKELDEFYKDGMHLLVG